jgi:hypothetical protein
MVTGYLLSAVAGAFAMNGLLHVAKGGVGKPHRVPWAVPASAPVNVVWGAFNWLVAIWLGAWAASFDLVLPVALSVGLVVGTAFVAWLAAQWQHDPRSRGEADLGPTA